MSLVEVIQARLDSACPQQSRRADAEHCVLSEPHLAVSFVQARGDPTGDNGVLGNVGVEQIQGHSAYVDTPRLDGHILILDRHPHAHWLAVCVSYQRHGQPVGIGVHPVLVLIPRSVEALVEVARPVEETDPNHGEAEV